jgi:hypothetical protein
VGRIRAILRLSMSGHAGVAPHYESVADSVEALRAYPPSFNTGATALRSREARG